VAKQKKTEVKDLSTEEKIKEAARKLFTQPAPGTSLKKQALT